MQKSMRIFLVLEIIQIKNKKAIFYEDGLRSTVWKGKDQEPIQSELMETPNGKET